MKKCKHCGTVQSDRSTCVECGRVLGRPLSAEEEDAVNEAMDDRLEDIVERADDFYVPLRDKIIGVLCILGAIAAILLMNFAGIAKKNLDKNLFYESLGPGYIMAVQGDTHITAPYESFSPRGNELNDASGMGLLALFSFAVTAPMLLAPRLMWRLDTLKYRLFYNWDTTPSEIALFFRKAATYLLFAIGVGCVLYGYFLYL